MHISVKKNDIKKKITTHFDICYRFEIIIIDLYFKGIVFHKIKDSETKTI